MAVTQQSPHELYKAAFAPRPELDAAVTTRLRRVASGTDLLAMLAGVWLLCAPSVLGHTLAERGAVGFWNAAATGGAIALTALIGASSPLGGWLLRVARMVLGGWLVVASIVLGPGGSAGPVANEVGVGMVSLLLAAIGLRAALLARRIGSSVLG